MCSLSASTAYRKGTAQLEGVRAVRLPRRARPTGVRVRQHAGLHPLRAVPDLLPDLRPVAAGSRRTARARRHGSRPGRRPPDRHPRSAPARVQLPGLRRLLGGLPGCPHGPPPGCARSSLESATSGRGRKRCCGASSSAGCSWTWPGFVWWCACCGSISASACSGWPEASASSRCWGSPRRTPAAEARGPIRSYRRRARTTTAVAFFAGCVMSTALADIDRATSACSSEPASASTPRPRAAAAPCTRTAATRSRAEARGPTSRPSSRPSGPIVVNCRRLRRDAEGLRAPLARRPDWAARARFSARVTRPHLFCRRTRCADHPRPWPTSVVYQDPCHLTHAQRIRRRRVTSCAPSPAWNCARSRSRAVLRQRGRLQRDQPDRVAAAPAAQARRRAGDEPDVIATANRLPAPAAARPRGARQPRPGASTSSSYSTRRRAMSDALAADLRAALRAARSSTRRPSCAPTATTPRS